MKNLLHFITVLFISIILFFSCTIGLGEAVDTQVPSITIVSPDPHVVYSISGDFLIKGIWKDDGVIESVVVTLKQDKENNAREFSYNAVFDEIVNNEHIWTCMIPAASEKEITDGSYLVSIKITDKYGHNSTATSQIAIDNTPPLIALTRPSSALADTDIDSYGQTFTLNGEAADDSGVSSIVMDIYSSQDIENPENKLHTKTFKNVLNNIKLTVAQFKEGDETNDYYKIYNQATVKDAVDKTFYCTITAYDGAVSFPADGSGPIEKGNSTNTYYLRDSISTLLQTYKSTGLYHIRACNYAEQDVSLDELNMDEYQISIGKFSLNPANNPKYNISDRFRITENGVNSETAKVKDGENIVVEVVPGLDGIAIAPDTLKVFTHKCDERGKITEDEESGKKYPESSEPIESGSSYKVTATISRNDYSYNSFYLIGIEGKDIQGNPVVAYAPNGYGFVFVASGLLPSVTVEKPADGAVFKKDSDVEVKGTIYYPEEGEFTIKLNDEALFAVTNESKLSPEGLKAGQLSYIKDEHTEGLYTFKYIIPAEKFNQNETLDYTLTFPDRDVKLAVPHGSADRSIKYDVNLPEVTLNFSGSAEDNTLLGPIAYNFGEDGSRADTKEYLNGTFAFECKVNDDTGIDFTNSKIQIIEKNTLGKESEKQKLTIDSENKTFHAIDTKSFADGSILIVRATILDTAGNSTSTEASYEVNQNTDNPLIFPVNDTSSDSTAKINFALDTKEKVQTQKDFNIVSAESPSVKLKFIDDDCIVGKNPTLKISYWKANQTETDVESEIKEFSTNELENIDEFIIENAETDFYIFDFEFIDGVNPDNKVERKFCVRVAPNAPAVKLEDVSVEYVTNSSVENKTEDAKVSLANKIIINSTEAPFRISTQIAKIDEEENQQIIIPYKSFEELTDATVTDNSATDGTFAYETPFEIPENFENGKYQLTYKVYDKSKQTSEDSITDTITFYVDKTAEEITDIEIAASDSLPFVVTCTKNGDAPVEYYWAFTEAEASVPAYGTSAYRKTAGVNNKVKLSDLFTSEGNKSVHVYAQDRAGNRSNIKTKTFIYDIAAPDAELVEKSFTSKNKYELNVKASDSWGIKKLEVWQKKDAEEADIVAEKSFEESESVVTTTNWKIENLPETIPEDFFAKYEYFVKAIDLAEKTFASEPIIVTIDNKKPVCSITTPTESVLNGALGEITGTASDGASAAEGIGLKKLYYQLYTVNDAGEKTPFGTEETIDLSGAINATWKISKTLGEGNDLTEGAYSLSVYAEDMAGNKGETKSINFFVDFAAPVVTSAKIGELPLEKNKAVYLKTDTTISVEGTITETNGIRSVTVNEQPASVSMADPNAADGRYIFTVSELEKPADNEDVSLVIKVTDKAGLESVNNYIVHNDKKTPVVVFSKPIVGESRLLNGESSLYDKDFKFIGSFDDGTGSGAASYKYTISALELTPDENGIYNMSDWPGAEVKDFNIPKNLSKEGENSTAEGLYYLYFYVEDKVGNSSISYISYWVDEKQPEITSLSSINATGQNKDGVPVVNNSFTISGTASDGNKIDYVEIKEVIQRNEEEAETPIEKFVNTTEATSFDFTKTFAVEGENAVSNGKHTYKIFAVDKAGRISASSTKEVWVDTNMPEISVSGVTTQVAYPANISADSTETKWYKNSDITFEVSASDINENGSGIFQVMATSNPSDESSWVILPDGTTENSYTGVVNCTRQGCNQISFRAIDNAGNYKDTTYPVYIDTESPVTASIESFYVGEVKITDFSNKILVNGKKDAIVSLSAQDFYAEGDTQKITGSGVKEITVKVGTETIKDAEGKNIAGIYDSATGRWNVTIPGSRLVSGTLAFDVKDNVENGPFEYTSDVIFDLDNEPPDIALINEVKNADATDTEKTHVNKTFTLTGKAHDTNRLLSVEVQYKKKSEGDTLWKNYSTLYENLTSWSLDINTVEKDAEENLKFEDKTLYDFRIIVSDTAQNTKTSATTTVYVNQDSDIPVLTFKDMSLAEMTSESPAESETNDIRINVFDDDGKIKSLEYRIGDAGDWIAAEFLNSSYIIKLPDGTYDGSSSHNPVINFKVKDAKDSEFTSPKLKGKDNSSTEETVLYVCVDTTAPYIQALNISRTGNTDDWVNATVFTETLGGDNLHNSFYLSINTYDANKVESVKYELKKGEEIVRSGNMSPVGEPLKKSDGFFYYQFKTSEPVSVGKLSNEIGKLSSGQYSLIVTVADKQENGKERQTSKTLLVDNTPPEVVVHDHNNPNHIELIGSAFTLQGSFNDGDAETTLKYQVTDSLDTSTLNDDAWVTAEGVSVGYWKIYFDSRENGIEGGYTHGKSPKYLIADARSDLTISSEGKVVYTANNKQFEDPLLCYFHLKGTDSYGNYSIYSLPLKLDPLGEIPDIYLDSPEIPLNVTAENSKLLSGIIRLSGHVNAVNSIKRTAANPASGVYIQIDPSFNGTFAADWNSQTLPNGKTFAEAGYTIVSFGSGNNVKQGIYVDDNLSWAFQLNKKSEFETADGTSTIAFRLFVVDEQNNVSRSDDVTYVMRVNAGVPKFGSSEELKLYRYGWSDSNGNLVGYTKTGPDENGTPGDTNLYGINDPVCEGSSTDTWNSSLTYTPSIKDYKENMFLKGKWFLTGSVEDEDHISSFTINNNDAKSSPEIEWTNTKTYGYRIRYIVGDVEANSCKVLTYKLSAKDGTSETLENDKHEKEENIIIRVDNKEPVVAQEGSENYGISKAILNKDGFYKIKSAATEDGNESGFLRTVFFFASGTSGNGTSGTVYDSYIKNSKSYSEAPDNVLDCSSLKYEDGLYWKKGSVIAIDKAARQITLATAYVNLHTGALVKLGGIIYTVTKLENSGTKLTLDGAPDLGREISSTNKVPVYIAIGHVVDHFGLETGGTVKNEAGYYTNIDGDDDDCMMESVNTTGTTTRWEASINSHNLRDGAVEIHYVVFDKAGNYTEKIITDAVVKNNAPRLASLKLWTDYNGNGSEDEGEYKTFYNSAKTRTLERADGIQYKEERATAVTDHLNVFGENGTAFMTIKGDDVKFTPEVIGGNGALYYSNAEETLQENRIQFKDSNNQAISGTDSINGNYTENDKNGQSYIKGQTMSFVLAKENLGNNSDLTEFNYWIWDSTLGTKQLNSRMTVALKILNSTTENPKVEFTPFYWNSKTDNSLYENNRNNGHIELVEALPKDTFKTGNTGIYDRDPKVSGKITVRGYVRDELRLKKIMLQVPDFTGLTSECEVAEYIVQSGNTHWTSPYKDQMKNGTANWEFSVTKDINDGDGHKAEWEFSWDTSYIDGITKENAPVIVSAVAGKDGETERASNATSFQMDIVPYITKVKTPLYATASDNYRSALGHYPVKPGDGLELYGFNLEQGNGSQGKITVKVGTAWKSGNLNYVTTNEKTYQFINGLNDNNASGEYTLTDEDKSQLTTSEGKDIYENLYNRQPDGVTNNTLTDDIYLDIWDFNPYAVKPVKGHIDQPIMKINPATGIIGFAFADGATYFSMGGKVKDPKNGDTKSVDYSYNYWLGAYDRFTSIGFAYDKWGYSYGLAAGGDINDNNSYDKVSFMMSRWGVCCKFADASKNTPKDTYKDKVGNNNKVRIERISQKPESGNVIVNKQRVQSPSIATTSYKKDNEEYTNVYLAYFDDINKEIRFRSGATNSTGYDKPSDSVIPVGMIGDDCSGNDGVKYNSNGDTIQKVNVVAGANTGRTAGKYVSISAIPKDKIDGATEDTVVIVWYDEDSKTLWYGYNKTPISSAKGVNSGSEWTVSRVFTDPSQSYYQAGANCQIIADELGGVHIAAYDEDNGHLIYAYKAAADTGNFTTCIVDSCGVVGSNLSLDIALNEAGTVAVPRIGYYDISNGYPKYAYLVSEDTDKLTGAENNMFTGNWECTIVPTTSNVSLDNSKQTNLINVGVWKDKDTGIIKNSQTGTNSQVNQFNGYDSKSYGVVYGNGSKNAVLGYLVAQDSSNDFIETAQIKPTE